MLEPANSQVLSQYNISGQVVSKSDSGRNPNGLGRQSNHSSQV